MTPFRSQVTARLRCVPKSRLPSPNTGWCSCGGAVQRPREAAHVVVDPSRRLAALQLAGAAMRNRPPRPYLPSARLCSGGPHVPWMSRALTWAHAFGLWHSALSLCILPLCLVLHLSADFGLWTLEELFRGNGVICRTQRVIQGDDNGHVGRHC